MLSPPVWTIHRVKQARLFNPFKKMARPERFELPTPRFVVWCSIQLSYGRLPRPPAEGPARPALANVLIHHWQASGGIPRTPGRKPRLARHHGAHPFTSP
jgi:hypothetical protein